MSTVVPKKSFHQKERRKRKEGISKKLKEAKKDKQKLKQAYNILAEKDVPKDVPKDVVRQSSDESLIFMGTDFYTPIIDLTQEDTMDLLRPSKKQMALNINDSLEIQPMEVQPISSTKHSKTSLKQETLIIPIIPIQEMEIDRRTSDRSLESPEQNPDHKI